MRDNPFTGEWQNRWGKEYDPSSKEERLLPVLQAMQTQGRLGNVVTDIGSGRWSICEKLKDTNFKLIKIDFAASGNEWDFSGNVTQAMDIESLEDPDRRTKEALVKIRKWMDAENIPTDKPMIDTAVYVDILNYVDYEKVISSVLKYQKPTGRIVIYNLPTRGLPAFHSEKGLKSNRKFLEYLQLAGMQVEDLLINDRRLDTGEPIGKARDKGFLVCVARKLAVNK